MQAEGIRTGDRFDALDDRGRIVGGWTATGDAVRGDDGMIYVPVKFHDGGEGTNVWADPNQQVPISFGRGSI